MAEPELELLLLLAAAGQGQGPAWPWLAEARPPAALGGSRSRTNNGHVVCSRKKEEGRDLGLE